MNILSSKHAPRLRSDDDKFTKPSGRTKADLSIRCVRRCEAHNMNSDLYGLCLTLPLKSLFSRYHRCKNYLTSVYIKRANQRRTHVNHKRKSYVQFFFQLDSSLLRHRRNTCALALEDICGRSSRISKQMDKIENIHSSSISIHRLTGLLINPLTVKSYVALLVTFSRFRSILPRALKGKFTLIYYDFLSSLNFGKFLGFSYMWE